MVVTGAAGFIGSALREKLDGFIGVSRQARPGLLRVADYEGAPCPPGAALVHLAEPREVGSVDEAQAEAALARTRRLLEKPWSRVVYASSAVVYGDRVESLRSPDEPVAPSSPYARAKLASEQLVLDAGGAALRVANVYGGAAQGGVLVDILRQLDQPGPLRLRDDRPVRDFIHVDDAAGAFAAALGSREAGLFNVGGGEGGVSIGDLARMVLNFAGQSVRPIATTSRSSESSILRLDIAATTASLGWRPKIGLATGLQILLQQDL